MHPVQYYEIHNIGIPCNEQNRHIEFPYKAQGLWLFGLCVSCWWPWSSQSGFPPWLDWIKLLNAALSFIFYMGLCLNIEPSLLLWESSLNLHQSTWIHVLINICKEKLTWTWQEDSAVAATVKWWRRKWQSGRCSYSQYEFGSATLDAAIHNTSLDPYAIWKEGNENDITHSIVRIGEANKTDTCTVEDIYYE